MNKKLFAVLMLAASAACASPETEVKALDSVFQKSEAVGTSPAILPPAGFDSDSSNLILPNTNTAPEVKPAAPFVKPAAAPQNFTLHRGFPVGFLGTMYPSRYLFNKIGWGGEVGEGFLRFVAHMALSPFYLVSFVVALVAGLATCITDVSAVIPEP